MQRCQNTIEMDQISKINVPNPDRATFIVIHKSLGREK